MNLDEINLGETILEILNLGEMNYSEIKVD